MHRRHTVCLNCGTYRGKNVLDLAAKAASKGIDTYEQERQSSAKEKTDGAIEDFFNNSAKATSAYLKEASEIHIDMVEAINTESYRPRLRKDR